MSYETYSSSDLVKPWGDVGYARTEHGNFYTVPGVDSG